jgi:hypothetical protein
MNHSQASRLPRSAPLLVLVAAGCAPPAPAASCAVAAVPPVVVAPASRPAPAPATGDETPERRAQRAWCGYLDVLFRRASRDDTPWPHREACLAQTSNAAPRMLEHTASCSQHALDGFAGDPLTPAYAALVKRCGVEALDATALAPAELSPFVDVVCQRAQACDGTPYADCRAAIASPLGARLGRAIGALNDESRARLRVCLGAVGCEVQLGDRLAGCLEPIMDKLLWLPPSREE